MLEGSRLQDRPRIVRDSAAQDASLSLGVLLRREWAYLSSPSSDAALRLYHDVLALTVRNPDRFRIHPELLGDDWIRTIAQLAEQHGMRRAQAQSLGTLVLAGMRGLLLDLLTSGNRTRVERGFEQHCALVETLAAGAEGHASPPAGVVRSRWRIATWAERPTSRRSKGRDFACPPGKPGLRVGLALPPALYDQVRDALEVREIARADDQIVDERGGGDQYVLGADGRTASRERGQQVARAAGLRRADGEDANSR